MAEVRAEAERLFALRVREMRQKEAARTEALRTRISELEEEVLVVASAAAEVTGTTEAEAMALAATPRGGSSGKHQAAQEERSNTQPRHGQVAAGISQFSRVDGGKQNHHHQHPHRQNHHDNPRAVVAKALNDTSTSLDRSVRDDSDETERILDWLASPAGREATRREAQEHPYDAELLLGQRDSRDSSPAALPAGHEEYRVGGSAQYEALPGETTYSKSTASQQHALLAVGRKDRRQPAALVRGEAGEPSTVASSAAAAPTRLLPVADMYTPLSPRPVENVAALLEQERRPLGAMFKFYASKRRMTERRTSQNQRPNGRVGDGSGGKRSLRPTMFMTWPNFSRFCFDFKIVPDLLSKQAAKAVYEDVLPGHSSGWGGEATAVGGTSNSPDSKADQRPAMAFSGYMVCLSRIAIRSSLWPGGGQQEPAAAAGGAGGVGGSGVDQHHQVFALLQWMDRSRGKAKIANGRCTSVIGPFRSTVTPRRNKRGRSRSKTPGSVGRRRAAETPR